LFYLRNASILSKSPIVVPVVTGLQLVLEGDDGIAAANAKSAAISCGCDSINPCSTIGTGLFDVIEGGDAAGIRRMRMGHAPTSSSSTELTAFQAHAAPALARALP
jgi:hypothetical protein